MKLFITDIDGYTETMKNVKRVIIKKENRKEILVIEYSDYIAIGDMNYTGIAEIPLKDIQQVFLVNMETMEEYFRYEK